MGHHLAHDPSHRSPWHDAAAFAARTHRHQTRRDGETPYFAHPARVALIVSTRFGCDDPETLAIALLHDTIEDSGTDYEDIAGRFGAVVADGVAALSKDAALPEAAREAHAEARLRAGDWRASLVKLADVLDNTADLAGTETANGGDDRSGRRGRLLTRARWAIEIAREHAESDPEHADLLRNAAAIVAEATKPFD